MIKYSPKTNQHQLYDYKEKYKILISGLFIWVVENTQKDSFLLSVDTLGISRHI